MSYKNTVKDYSQMIGYITRDKTSRDPSAMDQEPRSMFANGQLVKPNADGSRPGYAGVTSKTQAMLDLITPVRQKYIDLREAQINDPKGGTLKGFPNYEQFVIQEIESVKNTKDAKRIISGTKYYLDAPEKLSSSRKKLLDNLIDIENNIIGRTKPGHELAVQAGYRIKINNDTTAPPGSFKNLIDTDKKILNRVDNVIGQLDSGQIPLDDIIKEGSLTRYMNKPFGFKSPESFNKLIRTNKKYADRLDEFKLLNNQSFLNKYKGRGIMADEAQNVFEMGRTSGANFSQVTRSGPLKKVLEFADRHIDQGGELIRKIDDSSFIYNNKIFSTAPDGIDKKVLKKLGLQNEKVIDLVLEGPDQKEFKSIYDSFDKLKEYELIERPHPITGKKTKLIDLLKEADYIAGGKDKSKAKDLFSRSVFELDHFGSVKDNPFGDIRVIPRTINQAAGQFKRGVSTFKDIKQAEDFIGYSFTGDPLNSLNQYIDTELQRGQNPDYSGRSRKIAAAKTKAIDKAAVEIGQTGTKGGQVLTQSIPEGVLGNRFTGTLDKRMVDAYTGVPILEKTAAGKLTVGSRPVTANEPNISVPERDSMAKNLKQKLMKLDLNFLPKKLRTPLEMGQNIIRGVSKKDGGRIPYGRGYLVEGAKSKSIQAAKKYIANAFRTLGTRPAGVGMAGYSIADNLKKGENVVDATLSPIVGLELMLPNLFKESVEKITKNKAFKKALSLGYKIPKTAFTVGRSFTPIGAGITAAGLGIDAYKYGKERKKLLDSLTDEQKTNLFRQEQSDVVKQQLRGDQNTFDEFSAAEGGLANLMKKYYD